MESIIENLTGNPVFLAVAVVLALIVVFAFLKKLVKLALLIVAVLVLYAGYLIFTGKDIKDIPKELKSAIEKTTQKVSEGLGNIAKDAVDKALNK